MQQPIAAPSGRITVTLVESGVTRHRVYVWGEHDDVVNPGDMLIVSTLGDTHARVEVRTYLRGSEMAAFADAALACAALYDENADWLSAPVTQDVA